MADEENKVEYTAILRGVTPAKFAEIFAASGRKARETYFHRHGVRAGGGARRLPKPGAKNEARTAALYELLQQEADDQMSEEILRTWLLSKRPMLAAALDHLGIEHEDGLTDSEEIAKFEKLGAGDIRTLVTKLEPLAAREDVVVYLRFMGAKDVEKALS